MKTQPKGQVNTLTQEAETDDDDDHQGNIDFLGV